MYEQCCAQPRVAQCLCVCPFVAPCIVRSGIALCMCMTMSMQGQFVWLKFALEYLARRSDSSWTVPELAVALLDGVDGTYRFLLGSLRRALLAGKAEDKQLWTDIHEKLLPVLLVARQALTVPMLAWMSGVPDTQVRVRVTLAGLLLLCFVVLALYLLHAEAVTPFPDGLTVHIYLVANAKLLLSYYAQCCALQTQVSHAMECLSSLFPTLPTANGPSVIVPYHKSVLDFLSSKDRAGTELCTSASSGHMLVGAACAPMLLALTGDKAETAPDSSGAARLQYALRHGLYHLLTACQQGAQPVASPAVVDHLDALLVHFSFWAQQVRVYIASQFWAPPSLAIRHSTVCQTQLYCISDTVLYVRHSTVYGVSIASMHMQQAAQHVMYVVGSPMHGVMVHGIWRIVHGAWCMVYGLLQVTVRLL